MTPSLIKGFIMSLKTTLMTSALLASSAQAVDWHKFNSSALIEVNRGDNTFTSSCVIIRRNVILTAAHSVENIDGGHLHLGNSYSDKNQKIKFKKVIIHNQYNKSLSNFKNDIAIVVLEKNLPESIGPISISEGISFAEANVDRIGFGGRNGQNTRTWTNPKVIDYQQNTLILKDQLSVIGDSGGPIYYKNKLLGIHSTVEGSDKTYAVYVPNYIDWINENLPIKQASL